MPGADDYSALPELQRSGVCGRNFAIGLIRMLFEELEMISELVLIRSDNAPCQVSPFGGAG